MTKRDLLITMFPVPGVIIDLQEVIEETGIISMPALRTCCSKIYKREGVRICKRGNILVRVE